MNSDSTWVSITSVFDDFRKNFVELIRVQRLIKTALKVSLQKCFIKNMRICINIQHTNVHSYSVSEF